MWRINKIQIKNICTLKDVEYSFNQGVTTLVFGHNLDNEGQKNNGSGKSALTEAIVFGLTGSPLRQVKNDELINNEEKSAYIKICLDNTSDNTELEIDRTIYKKGSPEIVITMYRNGEIIDDGSTFKSGVDEYNKYILELLGLTKEDIYNSYVLSKHKYQDFLSASDKDKKEIINRFSNGNLVDQSILAVQNDKRPLENELNKTKLELSNNDGRISAIEEQIETEMDNSETRRLSKIQRIKNTREQISKYLRSIDESKIEKEQNEDRLDKMKQANEVLNEIDQESDNKSIDQILDEINNRFLNLGVIQYDISDISKSREDLMTRINQQKDLLDKLSADLNEREAELNTAKEIENKCLENYRNGQSEYDKFCKEIESRIGKCESERKKFGDQILVMRNTVRSNASTIADLEAKISGAIECPHCGKHFILGDKDFDIEKAKEDIQRYKKSTQSCKDKISLNEKELDRIEEKIDEMNKLKLKQKGLLNDMEREIKDANMVVFSKVNEIQVINSNISKAKRQIGDLEERINHIVNDLFNDLFDKVEISFKRLSSAIKIASESISSLEGAIKVNEELISKLESETNESVIVSLQTSLKEYKKKRALIYKKHNELEDRIKTLNTQEARFIAFKTYLANSKVEALNEITNGFLEQIGSDLRVRFDGYTMLKSGKIRDKISVSLLRDGIDAGSFSKFSEGEKARIQLATILAMNTLTNNNADLNKGLDILVLDEILAAVDEEGLTFILESLNKLKITSLVVSHGKTAESYPYKLVITKQNGISTIG